MHNFHREQEQLLALTDQKGSSVCTPITGLETLVPRLCVAL